MKTFEIKGTVSAPGPGPKQDVIFTILIVAEDIEDALDRAKRLFNETSWTITSIKVM